MKTRLMYSAALVVAAAFSSLAAQSTQFPFVEKFDTIVAPRLPAGWETTSNRSAAGDFVASTSVPLSGPNCVVSTDSKVPQFLTSPPIDFSGKLPAAVEFHERRTSSHNSGLLVEALINGDTSSAMISATPCGRRVLFIRRPDSPDPFVPCGHGGPAISLAGSGKRNRVNGDAQNRRCLGHRTENARPCDLFTSRRTGNRPGRG